MIIYLLSDVILQSSASTFHVVEKVFSPVLTNNPHVSLFSFPANFWCPGGNCGGCPCNIKRLNEHKRHGHEERR